MTKDHISEYRAKLEEIIEQNEKASRDNALNFVLTGDQKSHHEAITSHTAGQSYKAALAELDSILEN